MSLSTVGCKKSNESNKIKEGQSISSEEKGTSTNKKDKNTTFKPSDYTLKTKKEYVYEYLGLKFKLSNKFKKYMNDKKIAMLDDQSPIDKELKYAILTFEKMTEEQKNAVIEKMGDGYKNWKNELERIGTIGIFEKNTSKEKISKITKCDTHTKIGVSSDGKYDCYLSTNSGAESNLLDELKRTEIQIIDKKERPKNGFVLSEKTDLENTEAFNGKDFTSKDFKKYDLTMVNVFATWCTACVKEIPDLVEVQNEMKSKGVNIVGVVTDTVDDNGKNKEAIEKSKLIHEKTKASYPFLMPDKTNFNGRLNGIQAMPETFFVDSNGNIVGDTYSGAKSAKEWKQVIEKELKKIKNK